MKGIFNSCTDVEMIVGNCSITIPTVLFLFFLFLSFSHRLIYYSKYFPVHSCPLPLIDGHHQENKQEREGRASSPPGATEASQAREGATPRSPSHRRRRPEDDTGPITIDGVMPQKRFYRARAHVNPLSHNDCFE